MSESQRVTEAFVVALGQFPTDLLRRVHSEAEQTAPGSWLPLMLADYLEAWRT